MTHQEPQWPLTSEHLIGRDGSRHDGLKKEICAHLCWDKLYGISFMSMYNCEWEMLVSLFTGYLSADSPDLFVPTQRKYA